MPMSPHVFHDTIELVVETCCACECRFGITTSLQKRLREGGERFFCPYGHGMSYTKPENQRLREELEAKQKALTEAKCQIAREQAEKAQLEQQFQRHKKRVQNGVCPCCNRSFANLARHMKTKHPTHP